MSDLHHVTFPLQCVICLTLLWVRGLGSLLGPEGLQVQIQCTLLLTLRADCTASLMKGAVLDGRQLTSACLKFPRESDGESHV
jgi:hypothetical protein